MKKKYGQNFLINKSIVKEIIEAADIKTSDEILEVGPGDGILTKEIIHKKPKKFITIEIDRSLKKNLDSLFYKKLIMNMNCYLRMRFNLTKHQNLIMILKL